jgi:hypothetical protein
MKAGVSVTLKDMARQADLTALCNLIEQADLAIGTDPIPAGGIESARENLRAALNLARMVREQKLI